jgi:hypothetical protein
MKPLRKIWNGGSAGPWSGRLWSAIVGQVERRALSSPRKSSKLNLIWSVTLRSLGRARRSVRSDPMPAFAVNGRWRPLLKSRIVGQSRSRRAAQENRRSCRVVAGRASSPGAKPMRAHGCSRLRGEDRRNRAQSAGHGEKHRQRCPTRGEYSGRPLTRLRNILAETEQKAADLRMSADKNAS